jgi:amino acid permease
MAPNDFIYSEKTTSPKLASETESSNVELGGVAQEKSLHRQLKNRHVAMIRCISFKVSFFFFHLMHTFVYSIGGVIGTGLFLGTANSLQAGGPIGLLLGYIFVGTICYSVMVHSSPSFVLTPVSDSPPVACRYPSENWSPIYQYPVVTLSWPSGLSTEPFLLPWAGTTGTTGLSFFPRN